MQHCDAFDYWGKGTDVTVTGGQATSPTLFPLVKCQPETDGKITIGCLASDFYPKSLTFQWAGASGTLPSAQYPPTENNNKYIGVSLLQVSQSDWDSSSFNCSVTHAGGSRSVELRKRVIATVPPPPAPAPAPAAVTVTLNQPSAKDIFVNNEVKLECVITGQDWSVRAMTITWQINGRDVTDRITPEDHQSRKTSKITRTLTEWQSVNKVSCSATGASGTPVVKDLIVHKGDGTKTKVAVHVLPEELIPQNDSDEVSLVCLVSSPVLQDYYIAWSENNGQKVGPYTDGVDSPPQKTRHGYSVTNVYTTTKAKWKALTFECNVWPAGSSQPMKPRAVSRAQGNSIECDK